MVRRAEQGDIPFIVALAEKYHARTPLAKLGFSGANLTESLKVLLAGDGVVFVHKSGVICGSVSPLYFNFEQKVLCKLFWIAERDGAALLSAFEAWARENGMAAVIAGTVNEMQGDLVGHLLQRKGYVKLEQQLMKVF